MDARIKSGHDASGSYRHCTPPHPHYAHLETPRHAAGVASSLYHRHMPRHMARRGPVEARIVRNLDLAPERTEARPLIERKGRGMIEGAGVNPDAPDGPRPCQLQSTIHQPAAGA